MSSDTQGDLDARMTIGALAQYTGVRTSALRYYEQEGLLTPVGRTDAGYRLYSVEAEQTIQFIQRAQRLGFSLIDIRQMLADQKDKAADGSIIIQLAEERFLAIERQLTELLTLRHEMRLFLADLNDGDGGQPTFERLMGRVCMGPPASMSPQAILDWLMEQTHCVLATPDGQSLLAALRGLHVHLWQEKEAYHILVTSSAPEVEAALQKLAQLEAMCHAHPVPQIKADEEGFQLIVQGENAFIFAQLFLALEQGSELA